MRARLLIAAFCFAVVGCTLVDAPLSPNQVPDAPKATGVGYYVSPNGRADGDGSKTAPWDLQTALSQPPKVQPGDTIWMLAGTYKGPFVSKLTGTHAAPIIVRQLPGERATIDGSFQIQGSDTWYWGFEWLFSDPARVSQVAGSNPTDIQRGAVRFSVEGPDIKLINLTIHDGHDGVFAGLLAPRLEIYGCVIYNSGWIGPDRGHGHSVYLQNQQDTMRVIDNVMYNSFDAGLHLYGSDVAYLNNFHVEGNAIFGSGTADPEHGAQANILYYGGNGKLGHSVFLSNSMYQGGRQPHVVFGEFLYPPGSDLEFIGNIMQGSLQLREWYRYTIRGNKIALGGPPVAGDGGMNAVVKLQFIQGVSPANHGHVFDDNSYAYVTDSTWKPFYEKQDGDSTGAAYTLGSWQATYGYDQHSTHVEGPVFPSPDIVVRPNRFEAGRAFIYCWNWQNAGTLNVDLSGVLSPGDRYEIRNVYDVFGPPVVSGTYKGGTVSLPQTGYVPPTPIGLSVTPPSASPRFNAFLVQKVG